MIEKNLSKSDDGIRIGNHVKVTEVLVIQPDIILKLYN